MRSLHNWMVFFLVVVGCMVGMMSLYMASLTGVMNKMGLVGGDFRQGVRQNELARQLRGREESVNCSIWHVVKPIPYYFLSRGSSRVTLAGELGRERIVCGIYLVQQGNVERGVYTMIKGLYYLKSQYSEMRTLVQEDRLQCQLLSQTEYESWVQAYLLSSEGRTYDLVLAVYKQVEVERAAVEELCTN